MINIAVFSSSPDLYKKGQALASQLALPLIQEYSDAYDYLLVITEEHLALQSTKTNACPLVIDFLSKQMQYRIKQASLKKEALARALGLKNKAFKNIVDATAGLGRDSFILASLGFEVTVLERSPIIFALLQDAMARAREHPATTPIIKRMHLVLTNAVDWLKKHPHPDIIYLDPMFEERKKTALSKQDMRIFHEVVGHDSDAGELLKTALTCANMRVVVKRPRLANPLADLPPSFSMKGSSNRFDIYLTREINGNPTPIA